MVRFVVQLLRVHRYLNHKTAVKVANALDSSHLDCCNSLLYNTKRHILADYREYKMPKMVRFVVKLLKVHRYLNHKTAVKVANALDSSHLDCCNSLLYNTKRHILADYREYKMPHVVLCAN